MRTVPLSWIRARTSSPLPPPSDAPEPPSELPAARTASTEVPRRARARRRVGRGAELMVMSSAVGSGRGRSAGGGEGLVEVLEQVGEVLDADAQAQHLGADARRGLGLGGHRLMGH